MTKENPLARQPRVLYRADQFRQLANETLQMAEPLLPEYAALG